MVLEHPHAKCWRRCFLTKFAENTPGKSDSPEACPTRKWRPHSLQRALPPVLQSWKSVEMLAMIPWSQVVSHSQWENGRSDGTTHVTNRGNKHQLTKTLMEFWICFKKSSRNSFLFTSPSGTCSFCTQVLYSNITYTNSSTSGSKSYPLLSPTKHCNDSINFE